MKPAAAAPFKHIVACALLALALLGVQHAATLHWLSHAIDATHAKPDAAPAGAASEHCDACLAFSAFGSAAVASAKFTIGLLGASDSRVAPSDASARPATLRLAFRSRAPPTLI